jgi:hypothetical protein
MKDYIEVDEKEAVNEDGSIKEGYEKRAYCYVKLDLEMIEKINNNIAIYAKLTEIDAKSIRAIREGNIEYIKKYEDEAKTERSKLK